MGETEVKLSSSERVIKWLIFSVAIALMPLGALFLKLLMNGQSPSYVNIIGKGELFLVVIALCGAAIGDLVTSQKAKFSRKAFSGGCTLIVLILASLLYAGISDGPVDGGDLQQAAKVASEKISLISGILFAIGVFSCGCCIAISE